MTRLIGAVSMLVASIAIGPTAVLASGLGATQPAIPGATEWVSRYDGPSHGDDSSMAIAISEDGATVYVVGGSTGSGTAYDISVIAYRASTGSIRWSARYDGPAHAFDAGTGITVVPGEPIVVVSGVSRGLTSHLDYATIAFDASDGHRLWVRRQDGPAHGDDYPTAIASDAHRVYVTGYSRGAGTGDDELTVAYNAQTGATAWHRRFDDPGHGSDQARGIAVSADASRVYVVGSSAGRRGDPDITTLGYAAASGASVWSARYDGPGHYADLAEDIVATPDGSRVFVIGESIGNDGGWDYAVVRYDGLHAAPIWTRRYSGPAHRDDYPTALALSPDARTLFVTGYSTGLNNSFDYATVAYSAVGGRREWVARYDGPGHSIDDANAVRVSPDARFVVVTGASIGTSGATDYATVAYGASSGAQRWVRRYRGGSLNDFAYDLVVRPDSSEVFVTGESTNAAGDLDSATLAYSLR
jgi:hypothetical protein